MMLMISATALKRVRFEIPVEKYLKLLRQVIIENDIREDQIAKTFNSWKMIENSPLDHKTESFKISVSAGVEGLIRGQWSINQGLIACYVIITSLDL